MSVKKYDYTLNSDVSGLSATNEYTYNYSTQYPDRLTSFNGNSISYNSLGCPTYYNGRSYIWNKGKLSRIYRGSPTQGGATYERCTYSLHI